MATTFTVFLTIWIVSFWLIITDVLIADCTYTKFADWLIEQDWIMRALIVLMLIGGVGTTVAYVFSQFYHG